MRSRKARELISLLIFFFVLYILFIILHGASFQAKNQLGNPFPIDPFVIPAFSYRETD